MTSECRITPAACERTPRARSLRSPACDAPHGSAHFRAAHRTPARGSRNRAPGAAQAIPAALARRSAKPELDLRGLDVEARRVHDVRRQVVPVARAVARFLAVDDQQKLALCDDADVLGGVAMRLDHRALGNRGEEHIAVLRLEPVGVERALERRQAAEQVWTVVLY